MRLLLDTQFRCRASRRWALRHAPRDPGVIGEYLLKFEKRRRETTGVHVGNLPSSHR